MGVMSSGKDFPPVLQLHVELQPVNSRSALKLLIFRPHVHNSFFANVCMGLCVCKFKIHYQTNGTMKPKSCIEGYVCISFRKLFFFTPVAYTHVCAVCTCFSNNKNMNSRKAVE